ncbi:MAG: sigma-70 family RNA polymerase sigma factor [Sulfuricaulis sp.]|nr:sigma-70 family RNA polymerase sigma factor [Sulfuricaulis sp.]
MKEAQATETDYAASLLTRIASGNETALREFYQAFHGRVYAFAIKRLRDPADAADVLNEVMLEVWRSAARYEGRSRALTWVLGITHHKTIDNLRRRKNYPQDELDVEIEDENSPTALDALAGAEDAAQLRRCLEGLSDAHRLIVHLAFFEDLPYEEIAKVADCPIGTVKTRMFHAKRRLKRCLAALAEATG